MVKLNKEFINNLPEISEKEKTFWDDELTGFGLRVQGKYIYSHLQKHAI